MAETEPETECPLSSAADAAPSDESHPGRTVGVILLLLGVAGFLVGLLPEAGFNVPLPLRGALWPLFTLVVAVLGAMLTWRSDHPRTGWRPERNGRRFHTAVLYTRAGCHLCDEALQLLSEYSRYLPEIAEVDIDGDSKLAKKYGNCVPVVELDGRVRFRGDINEALLQRLIEGTPPASQPVES